MSRIIADHLGHDNVIYGNFEKHIECPSCGEWYPMDIFHNGECDGCALENSDNNRDEYDEPNGIPF